MGKMFPEIQSYELLAFSCQPRSSCLCSATAAAWDSSACYDDMRTCHSNSIHLTTWQILSIPSVWCQTVLESYLAFPWTAIIASIKHVLQL